MKMKKVIKSYITIILLLSSFEAYSQSIDDTLFVAAKSSVNMREHPDKNSKVLSTLNKNVAVKVCGIYQLDTIDYRIANWIKVQTEDDEIGFIYGGYLNRKPIPQKKFSSITQLLNFIVDYDELNTVYEFNSIPYGHKEVYNFRIYQNEEFTIVASFGYEWDQTDIYLENYSLNEILNLINNFEWKDGNPEYEQLLKSVNSNLKRFQYVIGHDDPEREIILEEGRDKKLRIQEKE